MPISDLFFINESECENRHYRTNVTYLFRFTKVRYRNTSKDSDRTSLLSIDNVQGIVPSSVADPDPVHF
jgi:hypothetical protein